jgi:3-isopropylmalate/(R)-2-methylmalate dehydratase small subunit
MEQFVRVTGIAAPLLRMNIDTDQIIPGREVLRGEREGYAGGLFGHWRYRRDREPDPQFILNREPWTSAVILLAGENFGCGSSRESAPKALRAFGFRAVIAPSFGGIFFGNCFRNGILPVELPLAAVRRLATEMEAAGGHARVTVDLETQAVTAPGGQVFAFRAPALLRRMLLEGVDEIDFILRRQAEIDAFRRADAVKRPWVYQPGLAD